MRLSPLLTAAVLAVLLALPSTAQAGRFTTLKVRTCQAGDTPRARQATFFSQMQAVQGTERMAMRFTVYRRTPGQGLEPVPNGGLQWRRSRPGVQTYGYSQTVTGLQPGVYAMGVDYRWVDAGDHVLRSGRRISGVCREDGPLPNLAIPGLTARTGDSPGTEIYSVQVTNNGAAPARLVDVDVFVDNAQADTARIDQIDPGETATVRIVGPLCLQMVRAVVDRNLQINETNENDNTYRSGCPAPTP